MKARTVSLGLLFISLLTINPLNLTNVTNAQTTSNEPNWAVPGTAVLYGWQLWEYFSTENLSSTISHMEQQFNIGFGNYTPKGWWESIWNFTLISSVSQQGVFQLSTGSLKFTGDYTWSDQTATWNYMWDNQKWIIDGQPSDLSLAIYASPVQLTGNPLVTVGNYQAYKVSGLTSTNRTLYNYYQKDTGILLFSISVEIGPAVCDLAVFGISSASVQIPQTISISFQQYTLSVTSNSTLSSVAYNSTSNKLSFSASGPSGTSGYAEVSMHKDLCPNINDLKVYLDESEVKYEYTSNDNSWIIKVGYQHSIHNIQITVPEFSSLVLIVLMLATTSVFSSLLVKPRKKLIGK